jgi:CTP synthase
MVKFIVVSGGVISGLGKGITTSSIGLLFKEYGYKVSVVKIDPYLNVDSGTMSPHEHGECYVLNDGGETDLDLGNYERFLNVNLTKNNNITTGKVYQSVINKERNGDYLGKTVQIVPHVINEINDMIVKGADGADICMIELGGTIGDIESKTFTEALSQLSEDYNVCFIHVSLMVEAGMEEKTKPTQHSVKELRSCGIFPNMLCLRSKIHLTDEVKEKLHRMCKVKSEYIIDNIDVHSIYEVPMLFDKQNVVPNICSILNIPLAGKPESYLSLYKGMVNVLEDGKLVKVGIVGKYANKNDTYLSVIRAIEHASYRYKLSPKISIISETDIQKNASVLSSYDAIVVPGGFGVRGTEEKITALKYCRQNKIPTLGICFGFQMMAIEYARNVCGLASATSEEIDKDGENIIVSMKKYSGGKYGGTMRLGSDTCHMESDIYGGKIDVEERFRHRYEVNREYHGTLRDAGMKFSGIDDDGKLVLLELDSKNYVGCQYHPEYKSRLEKPHPLFLNLLKDLV